MKVTVGERFFGKGRRWRTSSVTGVDKITLQGIGPDDRFNGYTRTVPLWWFDMWYVQIEDVPRWKFIGLKKNPDKC